MSRTNQALALIACLSGVILASKPVHAWSQAVHHYTTFGDATKVAVGLNNPSGGSFDFWGGSNYYFLSAINFVGNDLSLPSERRYRENLVYVGVKEGRTWYGYSYTEYFQQVAYYKTPASGDFQGRGEQVIDYYVLGQTGSPGQAIRIELDSVGNNLWQALVYEEYPDDRFVLVAATPGGSLMKLGRDTVSHGYVGIHSTDCSRSAVNYSKPYGSFFAFRKLNSYAGSGWPWFSNGAVTAGGYDGINTCGIGPQNDPYGHLSYGQTAGLANR